PSTQQSRSPPDLHSFPTRRSSDLHNQTPLTRARATAISRRRSGHDPRTPCAPKETAMSLNLHALPKVKDSWTHLYIEHAKIDQEDRKSTRLNSSHVKISYAVFCLK